VKLLCKQATVTVIFLTARSGERENISVIGVDGYHLGQTSDEKEAALS
jgi:hypothetical protein